MTVVGAGLGSDRIKTKPARSRCRIRGPYRWTFRSSS